MLVLWLTLTVPLAAGASGRPQGDCEPGTRALQVDLNRSGIKWKGTKFWGLGSHEGTVRLRSGEVCVRDGRIVGGTFVADMATIAVTDIPADDPVPRKRLRDHLLGEDFFHVAAYPEARLTLRAVERENRALHRVAAELTIRGRTHAVTFYTRVWTLTDDDVHAEARFPVDRHRWGVSYRGSTIKDDLVDDEFWLDLTVNARAVRGSSSATIPKPLKLGSP